MGNETSSSEKNVTRHLKILTAAVRKMIGSLDDEMSKPSNLERGKRVAQLCNQMEMINDQARHFGLGEKLTPAPNAVKENK